MHPWFLFTMLATKILLDPSFLNFCLLLFITQRRDRVCPNAYYSHGWARSKQEAKVSTRMTGTPNSWAYHLLSVKHALAGSWDWEWSQNSNPIQMQVSRAASYMLHQTPAMILIFYLVHYFRRKVVDKLPLLFHHFHPPEHLQKWHLILSQVP